MISNQKFMKTAEDVLHKYENIHLFSSKVLMH